VYDEAFSACYFVADLEQRLKEQIVNTTKQSLYRLIKNFIEHGVYTDLQCRARDKKLSTEMLKMINDELKENNEATARHLRVNVNGKVSKLEGGYIDN